MFQKMNLQGTLEERYALLNKQLDALLSGESDFISHLANTSALLNHFLEDINWVGFYLLKENMLVLGPFQGLPACVQIPTGRGVCGSAVQEGKTLLVDDVHQFPGHIACDAASRSEIVIPIKVNDLVIGVLDIDSPSLARFSKEEQSLLELFVHTLEKHLATAIK
ncbi:GAF domain-containing protein [Alkalihalobacillus pseudalcaliphilus]|uniref:GAF domain-containing protein n=1 Tax=Alkalihalobacillus pseudalcaliphilus TaxID=79884 RepID=UPI00064D9A49|nr:GAF domain-containing protein [Alkalihalobacillus pseudalcaliphilus]KMK77834.1 GAF domain-containing protein [Alkalihalobacillus pseudalcaliphilus]